MQSDETYMETRTKIRNTLTFKFSFFRAVARSRMRREKDTLYTHTRPHSHTAALSASISNSGNVTRKHYNLNNKSIIKKEGAVKLLALLGEKCRLFIRK